MDLAEVKRFYDGIAPIYDQIHQNPWMHLLRLEELRLIKKYARGRILDLGCGTGFHLARLDPELSLGLDLSRQMLIRAHAKRIKAQLVQANAEQLPFKPNSFDTVLCMYTVLNLCDWRKAIAEIHRVLDVHGWLITSVGSIWDAGGSKLKTLRAYGLKLKLRLLGAEFLDELTKIGFRITEFRGIFKSIKARWGTREIQPAQAWELIWEFDLAPQRGGIWLIAAMKCS